ncbi:MAG: TadE/TadG family type IV pilus assembly protein [Erythrobacter sp.]
MITITARLLASLGRFTTDKRGVSAVEFGLMLPLLMLIGAGGLEYINFLLAHQKVERAASITADNIARNTLAPSERSFADTFAGVNAVAAPFDLHGAGRVILTGVIGVPEDGRIVGKVVWQRCSGELAGIASNVGREATDPDAWAEAPSAVLPSNIVLLQNQLVVVSEIGYQYKPLISLNKLATPEAQIIRQSSLFVARGQAFPVVTPSDGIIPSRCQ